MAHHVGAIGFIDALGIRGRTADDPEKVLNVLGRSLETAERMKEYVDKGLIARRISPNLGFEPQTRVFGFSDTVAIAATTPEVTTDNNRAGRMYSAMVDVVCQIAGYVVRRASQAEPPILYRGVVTIGNLLAEGASVIGPAVDEAATLYELADGAFVWLAPAAVDLPPPEYGGPDVWRGMMFEHDVPLKSGQRFRTKVVSPFLDQAVGIEEREKIKAGYLQAFQSRRIDVAVKRQETMRFIDRVFGLE
jgi:hypothetical protein